FPVQFAQFPSNCILAADANCPKFWLSFQVKLLRRDSELLNRNYATFTIDSGLRDGLRDLDSRLSNGKWHLEEVDFGARTRLFNEQESRLGVSAYQPDSSIIPPSMNEGMLPHR
ncbi:unnamed protein product, partial [Heterotrigona itama]